MSFLVSKILGPTCPWPYMPFREVDLSSRFRSDISGPFEFPQSWRLMVSVSVLQI
jgi:hypothetical protein